MSDFVAIGQKNYMHNYGTAPICFERGEGVYLYDDKGNKYLDCVAGIAVNALGYNNKKLNAKIEEVLSKGILHVSNLYYNEYAPLAAEKLNTLAGSSQVFFANSGAEANEAALKMARKYGKATGRDKVISFVHSFHGRTYGALTLTGQEKYQKSFLPVLEDIAYATYNDLDSVKALIDDKTVAIIAEPVQGEGGIIPAEKAFLEGLRKLCDENDLLLIFDCVQCGLGRTGKLFAWQHYGVQPDIMTLAKALGGGVPLSATLAWQKARDIFAPGDHASTFGGNALATAASLVVLDELENGLVDHAAEMGDYFQKGLAELVEKKQSCVALRGLGLMLGIQLTVNPSQVIAKAREKGLLVCSAGYDVLRFVPPLIIEKEDIDKVLSILDEILE